MLVEATRKMLVSSGEIEAGTVVRDGDRFLLKSTAAWVDLETGASISAVSPKIEVLSGAKLVVGPAATSGRFSIFLDCDGDPTIRTPYGNAYCGTKAIRWMLANPEASAAMIKFYDENKGPAPRRTRARAGP